MKPGNRTNRAADPANREAVRPARRRSPREERSTSPWQAFALGLAVLASGGCTEVSSLASSVQVPVYASLTPYLIFDGYYLVVRNTSAETLRGVSITYYDREGNPASQPVGTIGPHATVVVDPSEIGWGIVRHEQVVVHADGYVRRATDTNAMIDVL